LIDCKEIRSLISLYIDGELDSSRSVDLEHHLSGCTDCRDRVTALQEFGERVREAYPIEPTPDHVMRAIAHRTLKPKFSLPIWSAPFAAGLAAGFALFFFMSSQALLGQRTDADGLVASHIRSMMAHDLVDVISSDRHTVKPWFQGKLSFSPTVVDLAKYGFPLKGGRIEYLNGAPAAALVYLRNRHVINIFVTEPSRSRPGDEDVDGFHIRRFELSGLQYSAVSDLNPQEISVLIQNFKAEAAK
jgi:anti-sigma factor RsiW